MDVESGITDIEDLEKLRQGLGGGEDDKKMVNQYNEHYLGDGCPKNPDLTTMQLLHVKKK